MSVSTSPIKWKASPTLQWHSWGDEYAIYNTASGDTHILDLISGQILAILEKQALDIQSLIKASESNLGFASNAALTDHIKQLMIQFHDFSLIEPVAP
jgi:PqqD family protein of HPr-rel-A system